MAVYTEIQTGFTFTYFFDVREDVKIERNHASSIQDRHRLVDYNGYLPHSSLDNRIPSDYVRTALLEAGKLTMQLVQFLAGRLSQGYFGKFYLTL